MKTVERLVLKYIVCIVYVICSLVPVKKRVVFATYRTTKLSDNFKFIYNEMKSQPLDYEYVFLLKKMDLLSSFNKDKLEDFANCAKDIEDYILQVLKDNNAEVKIYKNLDEFLMRQEDL